VDEAEVADADERVAAIASGTHVVVWRSWKCTHAA
jgi:hypothetical protein